MVQKKNWTNSLNIWLIGITFLIIFSCVGCQNVTNNTVVVDPNPNTTTVVKYPLWLNSSSTEYNKFLTDKYNYYLTPKGNKVWVSAMNLAWNQLKRGILNGQNATFKNLTQLQQHMFNNLNSQVFSKEQLSQDAYYIGSGYGQEAVDKINFEVKQKFPLRTLPDLQYKLNEKDFISFAYLFKNFKFPTAFSDYSGLKFKNTTVRAFQSLYSKQRKQLYYKYYNNTNDFMIAINTKNENDEIFLWKTNITQFNNMKMDKFMQIFDMFYKLESQRLAKVDKFIMPVIDLDYSRSYKDLLEVRFDNDGFQQYKISAMDQRLKLKVTKEGVLLQAQAVVIGVRMAVFEAKYFYLNNDFWIILKEKNKLPYLVTFISQVNESWYE